MPGGSSKARWRKEACRGAMVEEWMQETMSERHKRVGEVREVFPLLYYSKRWKD